MQLARLIKGLRDRGLLDGEADPSDRRNTRLTLTDAGQAVITRRASTDQAAAFFCMLQMIWHLSIGARAQALDRLPSDNRLIQQTMRERLHRNCIDMPFLDEPVPVRERIE